MKPAYAQARQQQCMQERSCTWVALHVHAGHVLVPSCAVEPLGRRLLRGRQRGHDAPLRPATDCWWQWRHGTLQVPAAVLSGDTS